MEIKVKSLTGIFPEYETEGSAGMDIRAHLENPMEKVVFPELGVLQKIRGRSNPEKERSYLQDFFWKSQRAVKCRYVQGADLR